MCSAAQYKQDATEGLMLPAPEQGLTLALHPAVVWKEGKKKNYIRKGVVCCCGFNGY